MTSGGANGEAATNSPRVLPLSRDPLGTAIHFLSFKGECACHKQAIRPALEADHTQCRPSVQIRRFVL
jgi:hypothetical protein